LKKKKKEDAARAASFLFPKKEVSNTEAIARFLLLFAAFHCFSIVPKIKLQILTNFTLNQKSKPNFSSQAKLSSSHRKSSIGSRTQQFFL
jgi:hypothetical protein